MRFPIQTKGFTDIIDITSQVSRAVKEAEVKDGICLISSPLTSTIGQGKEKF